MLAAFAKEHEKQEEAKAKLEQSLADPELYKDQEKFTEKSKDYSDLKRRLELTYTEWEKAQEQLEEAKQKFC